MFFFMYIISVGRLHPDVEARQRVTRFLASYRDTMSCPPLFADLVGAVVDDCTTTIDLATVWAIGHPCGLAKCAVVAKNLHAPCLQEGLGRPTTTIRGMSGALVFMASKYLDEDSGIPLGVGGKKSNGNFAVTVCGMVAGPPFTSSFGTRCCSKAGIQGMVVMAVHPRRCIRFFPELAAGCVGIVDRDKKSKNWVVFASMQHALQARTVLSKAHCRLSRICPWVPEVVGAANFHRYIEPVVFERPVATEPLPRARTMVTADYALMGITPKGCARRVSHFPGFIGLVTGRHAEASLVCRDWMLFDSCQAAQFARNDLVEDLYGMSFPCPVQGWIGHPSGVGYNKGFIVSRVVDWRLLWVACVVRSSFRVFDWRLLWVASVNRSMAKRSFGE